MALHLVITNGKQVGKMLALDGDRVVVGRAPDCALIIDEDGVSRRHIVLTREGDVWTATCSPGASMVVNGELAALHVVVDGDRIQIGNGLILKVADSTTLARTVAPGDASQVHRPDHLTGLLMKKEFAERIKAEFSATVERRAGTLSLVLFDLDWFAKLNDTHGHVAGDFVLKAVSSLMIGVFSPREGLARYGGEELGISLPGLTGAEALALAERVRAGVESWPMIHEGRRIPVTLSAGVATLVVEGIARNFETPKALVKAADEAVWVAKRAGRNRVKLAESNQG